MKRKTKNNDLASYFSKSWTFYKKHYRQLPKHYLDEDKEIFLGNNEYKVCRFCHKDEKETTFLKKAHAIPNNAGNKCLFSYYECDNCNKYFSRYIENDFANYMNIFHSFAQTEGKKGIAKHISMDNKSRVFTRNQRLIIADTCEQAHTILSGNQLTYHDIIQPHIPQNVFKCFVKMALSIMPEEYIPFYEDTINWIRPTDRKSQFIPNECILRYMLTPQPVKPRPYCFLLVRNGSQEQAIYPYIIFNIVYGYFSYSIVVPSPNDCHFKTSDLPFPNDSGVLGCYGSKDLSSSEKINDDEQSITFTTPFTPKELDPKSISNDILQKLH